MELDSEQLRDLTADLERVGAAFSVSGGRLYPGPNPHCDRAAILFRLVPVAGRTFSPIANPDLAHIWPGLSLAPAGPAKDGDALARAASHAAALAGAILALLQGMQMQSGAASDGPEGAICWIEYLDFAPALEAFKAAMLTVAELSAGSADLVRSSAGLTALRQRSGRYKINPINRILLETARARGIPEVRLPNLRPVWQFGWGSRSNVFREASSDLDGMVGARLSNNKIAAKSLMRHLGLPTPAGEALGRGQDPLPVARKLGWPCVVKPLDRSKGTGVTANISDPDSLARAVHSARLYSDPILIEAHQQGVDYRLTVIDGRLVAACRREPPIVTGDGRRSVKELIADLNASRTVSAEGEQYVARVTEDEVLADILRTEGLSLQSVLGPGRSLALRPNSNISGGGIATACLSEVHPEVRGMAELLAAAFGLRAVGIDYITPDISRPHGEVGGGFIELNARPGIFLPKGDGAGPEEMASLLLGDDLGRIPVTLLIGTAEMLEPLHEPIRRHVSANPTAAATAAGWTRIGPVTLPVRPADARENVQTVLRHRKVESLIILWPLDELYELGLPVDRVDRTIILGSGIDEAWLPVLQRGSEAVSTAADPAALLSALGLDPDP